jgi:hypothetical protein
MIELAAPDLAWMARVHRPDEGVHSPTQLLETRNEQGHVFIPEPHGLCVRGDVACVHRGLLPGVPAAPDAALATWAVQTFFETAGLQPVRLLTLDGLQRWVRDAPAPLVSICTTCGGDGIDPNGKPDDEGRREACPTCHGEPRHVDESGAYVEVGPIKVVLSALRPFLKHLGGANVALATAPRVGVPGAWDLHVRDADVAAGKDGAWRVTLLGF